MNAGDRPFFNALALAAARLQAAEDATQIRECAEDLLSIAATFCGNALALIDEVAGDDVVRPLFDNSCRGTCELQDARDRLLQHLRGGCLRCNGHSPFDAKASVSVAIAAAAKRPEAAPCEG